MVDLLERIGLFAIDVIAWVCVIIAVSAVASANAWNNAGGIAVVFVFFAAWLFILSRMRGGPRWLSAAAGAVVAGMLYRAYG